MNHFRIIFVLLLSFICRSSAGKLTWKTSLWSQKGDKFKLHKLMKYESESTTKDITDYLLKIEIVDLHEQVQTALMYSVEPPIIKLLYLKEKRSVSSFDLTVTGITLGEENSGSPEVCWFYPLAQNNNSLFIEVKIPTMVLRFSTIHSMRIVYQSHFLGDTDVVAGVSNFDPTGRYTFNLAWMVDITSMEDSGVVYHDGLLGLSSDGFQSMIFKKINVVAAICSDGIETSVSLYNSYLIVAKSVVYLLRRTELSVVTVSINRKSSPFKHICIKRLSKCTTPTSNHRDVIIMSDSSNRMFASSTWFEGDSGWRDEFKEMVDQNGEKISKFFTSSSCVIVTHLVINCHAQYSKLLVVIQCGTLYKIVEITEKEAIWRLKISFHSETRQQKCLNSLLALNNPSTSTAGHNISIIITGASGSYGGEQLYLWGNTLIVYDVINNLLAHVCRENGIFLLGGGDAIRQLNLAANSHTVFYALTNAGRIIKGRNSKLLGFDFHVTNITTGIDMDRTLGLWQGCSDRHMSILYVNDTNELKMLDVDHRVPYRDSVTDVEIEMRCQADLWKFEWMRSFPLNPPFLPFQTTNTGVPDQEAPEFLLDIKRSKYNHQSVTLYRENANKIVNLLIRWQLTEIFTDYKEVDYDKLEGFDDFLYSIAYQAREPFSFRPYHELCSLSEPLILDRSENFTIVFDVTSFYTNIRSKDVRIDVTSPHVVQTTVQNIDSTFHVTFSGTTLSQRPPGEDIEASEVSIFPVVDGQLIEGAGVVVQMRGGCPQHRHLVFNDDDSGKDEWKKHMSQLTCPFNSFPCFQFLTDHYLHLSLHDMQHQLKFPFMGNYTFKVIGGGRGISPTTFIYYTYDEIQQYNYLPANSETFNSQLIWQTYKDDVIVDDVSGNVVFSSEHPNPIRFSCNFLSPCGRAHFWLNDSYAHHFLVEISNRGVDSSTNCDFTSHFIIHVIGLEMNPLISLTYFVLFTLISVICIFFIHKKLMKNDKVFKMKGMYRHELQLSNYRKHSSVGDLRSLQSERRKKQSAVYMDQQKRILQY